jgi:hypothetical protein
VTFLLNSLLGLYPFNHRSALFEDAYESVLHERRTEPVKPNVKPYQLEANLVLTGRRPEINSNQAEA